MPLLQEIRRAAMDYLARREHSQVELRQKLARKFPDDEEAITAVLARLQAENLQSDGRFAESFTHHRMGQGYGPARIHQELLARGVTETLVAQQLEFAQPLWQEHLTALWQKKFGTPPTDYQQQAKQARYLQNRGFAWEQIKILWQELA